MSPVHGHELITEAYASAFVLNQRRMKLHRCSSFFGSVLIAKVLNKMKTALYVPVNDRFFSFWFIQVDCPVVRRGLFVKDGTF